MPGPVLILDNGAGTIKAGIASVDERPKIVAPNCTAKAKVGQKTIHYTASDIANCRDTGGLAYRRPCEKGYLTHWPLEQTVWAHVLQAVGADPTQHQLLLTEAPFNFKPIQQATAQQVFETFKFQSLCVRTPAALSLLTLPPSPTALIVDVGYSFSHTIPFFDGFSINYGIRRVDVGGKSLTNYLKELVSYRHWNMMQETHLMTSVKERLCYVSQNYLADLASTKKRDNAIRREFVLPDYVDNFNGYIKGYETPEKPLATEQVLPMNSERITVPEILFNPSDIGIEQGGIADAILQSVQATHPDLHEGLYKNIFVTGGSSKFPGFKDRLFMELRQSVPEDYAVNITMADEPELTAYRGGVKLATSPDFAKLAVTKAEYQENGIDYCLHRFIC